MREAARTRRAAVEATADVEPTALREYITNVLQTESMTPGAVTIACADGSSDDSSDLVDRAAGVQLIYDGLRLTRHLATTEPWDADSRAEGDADLRILAADILVARGFELLARTPAAQKAVETVRSFGRAQRQPETADVTAASQLEADVAELAVIAGTTLADADPDDRLRQRTRSIAEGFGVPFPPAERFLMELPVERSSVVDPISTVDQPAPARDDD